LAGEGSDGGKVVIELDMETGKFEAKINGVKQQIGGVGAAGDQHLPKLGFHFIAINEALELANKAMEYFKTGLEMALKTESINNQKLAFKSLATSIGADSEKMMSAMRIASKGTKSDLELMTAAMDLMYAGVSTKQIPEFIKLANQIQATGRHGEKFSDVIRTMGLAIESGQVRAMKNYDMVLGKVGDRQTNINAIIEAGKKRFGEYGSQIDQIAEKVEARGEQTMKSIKMFMGQIFSGALFSAYSTDAEKAEVQIKALEEQLESLKNIQKKGTQETTIISTESGKERMKISQAILETEKQLAAAHHLVADGAKKEAEEEKKATDSLSDKQKLLVELTDQQKRRAEISAQIMAIESRVATESEISGQMSVKTSKDLIAAKKQEIEMSYQLEKEKAEAGATSQTALTARLESIEKSRYEKLRALYVDDATFKESQEAAALSVAEKNMTTMDSALDVHKSISMEREKRQHEEKLELLRAEGLSKEEFNIKVEQEEIRHQEKMKQVKDRYAAANQKNLELGFGSAIKKLGQQYGDFSQAVERMTMKTHGIMSKSFVDAAKNHGNAMEMMKNQFLEMIGTELIEQGTYHLLAGIWPPNPAELGQGAAMVAAGSALVGASAPSTPGAGGGESGGGFLSSPMTPDSATATQLNKKQAAIVINGDFLNSRETANHLAEVLRQNSDVTDYTITAQGRSYLSGG
jgi:hypothetical protein